ncbi:carbonic anhydrase family protein [Listeria grandensis]|uniref:carbonic anhydrase n=1 Tax=Listeria grandensis TaxID=1494963 RepID=UPI001624626A|nr:carbonic anhydrase family protein [Listeria grandensis]MBC1475931.1 carbonic anhydrase family protein [Listeria grandensis]
MKKRMLLGVLLTLGMSLAACNNAESNPDKDKDKASDTHESHLDYSKQADWKIETGKSQSPINIDTTSTTPMKDQGALSLNYDDKVLNQVDNGHSIQVNDDGVAEINGRNFELKQFHFHAKSEHTLDGKYFPIEAHFVNQSQAGRLAVIGVFFKEGNANPGFQAVLEHIKKGKESPSAESVNVASMLPSNKSYYHYLGSLTTPPLTENVEWYVMATPVEVSKQQIETFNEYYDGNNRKVQPLNDREILSHKE